MGFEVSEPKKPQSPKPKTPNSKPCGIGGLFGAMDPSTSVWTSPASSGVCFGPGTLNPKFQTQVHPYIHTLHYITLQYSTVQYINYSTLHYSTVQYVQATVFIALSIYSNSVYTRNSWGMGRLGYPKSALA